MPALPLRAPGATLAGWLAGQPAHGDASSGVVFCQTFGSRSRGPCSLAPQSTLSALPPCTLRLLLLQEVPQGVVDVIDSCLCTDPSARPSALEVYAALRACPPVESPRTPAGAVTAADGVTTELALLTPTPPSDSERQWAGSGRLSSLLFGWRRGRSGHPAVIPVAPVARSRDEEQGLAMKGSSDHSGSS